MKHGECPKCTGKSIIAAALLDETHVGLREAAVSHKRELFDSQRFGRLTLLVCRACGFTEMWAEDPAAIPIGDEYGTVLLDELE